MKNASRAVARPAVGAVEADQMIDAVAVEEVRAAPRPLAQPPEILRGDHVPAVDRHAPVLSGRAEGVGRRAQRQVEPELILPRPHVGAVGVHHERQIAEQLHAVQVAARLLPLRAGQPLQVLMEQDLARQLAARVIDRARLPPLQRLGPFRPWLLAFVHVDGAKERVVLDPPGLFAQKRPEGARARRVLAPLDRRGTDRRRSGRRAA